jgi:hypothetical protein
MARRLLLLAVFLALPSVASAAPRVGWSYEVRFDADLGHAEVRCDFTHFWPRTLVSDRPGALAETTWLRAADGATIVPRASDGGLEPVFPGASRRVSYRVDLRALTARGDHERLGFRVGHDLVLAPGTLLLRPALWPRGADVRVRFVLPEGYRVALPWEPLPEPATYRLDPHTTRLLGLMGVGRFPRDRFAADGCEVDVAVLDAPHRASRAGIRTWIRQAVGAVSALYGRFPTPRLTALVHPVPGRSPPVVFGTAMRAGGGQVHLLLSADAEDDELPGEWIAVHELTHLGMPWTYDKDAWLQEGFVTYYQEVLRARAGFLTEREGWQRIHDGFQRGRRRGGERPLAVESKEMHRDHSYRRVYWSGAAMALLIDVALRRRSHGTRSLDDVMRFWHAHYGGTRGPTGGVELMRAVDRALGGKVCEKVAGACLVRSAFPDVSGVLASLGVRVVDDRVELDDSAPEAALRRAMLRPTPSRESLVRRR